MIMYVTLSDRKEAPMPQENVRRKNKQQVIETALSLGLQKGIDHVSIREIAHAAGLTERSVYRYFESRGDLILSVTYLFWDKLSQWVQSQVAQNDHPELTGLEQAKLLMRIYSRLYIEHPEYVRFILGVEMALHSAGITASIRSRPPGRFDTSNSPMARALRQGQKDGSIHKDADIKMVYYNAYDAILGTMQRQLLDSTDCDLDNSQRMEHLCKLFIRDLLDPVSEAAKAE